MVYPHVGKKELRFCCREGSMHSAKRSPWILFVLLFFVISISCNMPFADDTKDGTGTPATPINATDIAQTVIAEMNSPTLTVQGQPTAEDVATRTPQPPPTNTSTQIPTATLTQKPCNQAAFLADVTIPDGSEIQTSTNFTKTWRLQNTGSCTWTSGYLVVYQSGDRMGAPDAVAVTGGTVPNGGSVDVSVALTAPASAGTYRGYFKLRSPEGVVFGVGGGAAFYVEIAAVAPAAVEPPALPPAVVAEPDLKITDITFSPYPPKKGQAVTVKVTSYNQGNAPAGAYTVQWWPGEYYPAPACTWNIGGMVAKGGQVHTCVYAGYPSVYAGINTKASVDTGGSVAESNEGNNTLLKSIAVVN